MLPNGNIVSPRGGNSHASRRFESADDNQGERATRREQFGVRPALTKRRGRAMVCRGIVGLTLLLGLCASMPPAVARGDEPISPAATEPGEPQGPQLMAARDEIVVVAAPKPAAAPPMRFVGRRGTGLADGKGIRQREGTKLVDRRGVFEVHGERVIFVARNPDVQYVVLENLALERVVRVVDESGTGLEWSINGELTEFNSKNFLQVTRAVLKTLPGKGAPRELESMKTAAPAPVLGTEPKPLAAGEGNTLR